MKKMKILMTLPFPCINSPFNEHIPLLIEELKARGMEVVKFFYCSWYSLSNT